MVRPAASATVATMAASVVMATANRRAATVAVPTRVLGCDAVFIVSLELKTVVSTDYSGEEKWGRGDRGAPILRLQCACWARRNQAVKKPVRGEVLSSEQWAMVKVTTPTEKRGSGVIMAGKSPRGSTKKEAKLSIKDKRAQKRAKLEDTGFIKPRKGH